MKAIFAILGVIHLKVKFTEIEYIFTISGIIHIKVKFPRNRIYFPILGVIHINVKFPEIEYILVTYFYIGKCCITEISLYIYKNGNFIISIVY